MIPFTNVFNWLAHEVLGGSRTARQAKHFVEHTVLSSSSRFQMISTLSSTTAGGTVSDGSEACHGHSDSSDGCGAGCPVVGRHHEGSDGLLPSCSEHDTDSVEGDESASDGDEEDHDSGEDW